MDCGPFGWWSSIEGECVVKWGGSMIEVVIGLWIKLKKIWKDEDW